MDTLKSENVWADKHLYDEAERKYYERLYSGESSTSSSKSADPVACQKAVDQSSKQTDTVSSQTIVTKETEFQKKVTQIEAFIKDLKKEFQEVRDLVSKYDSRLKSLESGITRHITVPSSAQNAAPTSSQKVDDDDADDGVDLFGSDSEDEDAEAKRIKEQRLAEYAAKKSKKPTLIAKSNIILDVKPWDDETDMKELEKAVRNVAMDGLVWGASKLVPLAYGIHKLQISCVVEDEKVSVDLLQEQIQEIEDYVQSVDIAAFNKI